MVLVLVDVTMMDNIEKLYRIAGAYLCNMPDIDCNKECNKCEDYNPFTAEKQLELIKLISNKDGFCNFHCYVVSARWSLDYGKWAVGVGGCDVSHEQFEQALAGLILEMWDGISLNQKEEIKRILE